MTFKVVEITRFSQSKPGYQRLYDQTVREYNEIFVKSAEMEGFGRSKRYIRKHAPIVYNIENVVDVVTFIETHVALSVKVRRHVTLDADHVDELV